MTPERPGAILARCHHESSEQMTEESLNSPNDARAVTRRRLVTVRDGGWPRASRSRSRLGCTRSGIRMVVCNNFIAHVVEDWGGGQTVWFSAAR
jgi:hypothetical protein